VVAAVWLGVFPLAGAHAQSLAASVSVSVVEPKDQSKWGYAPANRKVAPGTWVTWSNDGQDAHTVTAVDGAFDSGNLDPSQGFSWYFDQPGTFQYLCALHPWMAGTIVVSGQPSAVSDQPAVDTDPAAPTDEVPPTDDPSVSDAT
jgi:plastocyanin